VILTFAEALEETEDCRRYVLLGNGFSISLFPERFTYVSLFESARSDGLFDATPEIAKAFEALGTKDFEELMDALKASAKLAPIYGGDSAKMMEHSNILKGILVNAIANKHPSRPGDITDEQFENCRAFLSNFIGTQRGNRIGKVFSLNYDLLLYWSVLHDTFDVDWLTGEISVEADQELDHDDGFRADEEDYEAEYVVWDPFHGTNSQSIFFLHGALHLYERGPQLAKMCWERAGNDPLMDQIRRALDDDRFPLFVSEGSSSFKMKRINRSAYLSRSLRSSFGCCGTKNAAIFVIGHSLAANDDHILRRIKKGKIGRLYVSLFGDPDSSTNMAIRARAQALADGRLAKDAMTVRFIRSDTIHVWDHAA
jgi:hypothetical protein